MQKAHRFLIGFSVLGLVLFVAALCEARPAARAAVKTAASPAAADTAPAPAAAGVVNLNTASEQQLQLLPRIGPAKARAIIKHRSRQKFKATSDLVQVKGIGRKTFRMLRPYLSVQGETTLASKPKLARTE
jgi:competence protein ComEA